MTLLLAIGIAVAGMAGLGELALKFGAESRPGFDESAPLS